ncbi:MAG TPA: hypothetical protein PK728_00750 [Bacillota bacterium]|nr:hypothetical protein [Bacillota bacterium]
MKKEGKVKPSKWDWRVWAVVIAGFVIFALPIDPEFKFWLSIPLYAMFAYVYYRFVYKKKSP